MPIYEEHILPHLIHCACGSPPVTRLRQKIVPLCEGKVLEIGMGSGLNLPYYDSNKVEYIWGLEPSEAMRKKASTKLLKSDIDVKWLDLPSEEIPLEKHTVDTILLTFCLCTIENAEKALREMYRVLKPSGKLLFIEHGLSDDKNIAKWQNNLTPYWKKISGGCHLNRKIDSLISSSGFNFSRIDCFYQDKLPKAAGFIYLGEARKH